MFGTPKQVAYNAPQSPLEQQLIIDFLADKGYTLKNIKTLPASLAKELMTAACSYASLKLAEIEARSKFHSKIQFEG
jgi:DNA-binding transcriptional MerR regulator